MADTVTGPTILQQNDKRVVIKIVNQSDGNGGTTVFGDVSALDAREDGTAVAHLDYLEFGIHVKVEMVEIHLHV